MKKVLFTMLLLMPAIAFSQDNPPQVIVFVYDTIRTFDPLTPNDQYLKIYSKSGRIYKMGRQLNGKKEGIWKSYYENAMVSNITEYHEDVPNGISLVFEPTGYLSRDFNMVDGVIDGLSHEYLRNGIIKFEENYKNGVLNGWRRAFTNEGKLQEEGGWKNGKRDSINRWAYPTGNLYVEYYYTNGSITGPAKTYWENGKIKSEGNFIDGVEEGKWKENFENGNINAEGKYLHGKKSGVWKIYADDATLVKTQEYDAAGKMIKESSVQKTKQK